MTHRQHMTTERLQQVLDIYGAGSDNWPPDERSGLRELVRSDDAAAALYQQARAFDDLLDLATDPSAQAKEPSPALADAILADFAALKPAAGETAGVVLPFPSNKRQQVTKRPQRDEWMMAASALAACFLVGLYLGVYGLGSWTLDPVSTIAGLSQGAEQGLEISDYIVSAGLEDDLL